MIVILLGAPGSGKGSVGSILARDYALPKIATGDIFREEVAKTTALGKEVESYLKRGELVPDAIVNEVVRRRISQEDCANGFILDGYPRTLDQAKALEKALSERGSRIDAVVNIVVDEKELIARMAARRTCANCGAIYNLVYSPKPRDPKCCDVCGGELYAREDQREEIVAQRLKVYKQQTQPLIDYYAKQGLLRSFDGSGKSIEQNYLQLLDALKDVLPKC